MASHEDELAFHQAMIRIYDTAKREANYTATRFLQMLSEQGGPATARLLLYAPTVSDGFTALWQAKRLDLSVEAHVLRSEFAGLFSAAERETARTRLQAYGFFEKAQS